MNTQVDLTNPAGTDPLVAWMIKNKIPVTRERYLDLAYGGNPPLVLGAEQEMLLPEEIREL